MEAVVLHRVGFLEYFCPKHGQDFKPSVAPLYPNMGQVHPPPSPSPVRHQLVVPTCIRLSPRLSRLTDLEIDHMPRN